MSKRLAFAAVLLCGVPLEAANCFAEECPSAPVQSKPVEASQKRSSQQRAEDLAVLVRAVGGFTLKRESGDALTLRKEPVYRWTNPIAAAIGREIKDAAVFVWIADDRPAAIGSVIWYSKIGLYHEFQSLESEPITAERAGKKIWAPAQSGLEFKPVPDAPAPAATAAARLVQMRAIAGRFRAEVIKGPPSFPKDSVWQLRLLPTPLLRYGKPSGLARDGAIFAFCQDTDPDAFLMLEARPAGDELQWRFAMGPLASRETRAWCDDALVWSKPLIAPPTDPKRPYFVAGPFAAP
jgi:hypothetical protein